MPHASLSHPTRGSLEFRQGQQDEDVREAVTNIAPELGTDRKPLVHIQTQQDERTIQGRVTAPRRAANDTNTSDWEQALANYADLLEAHCDEFQGFGSDTYTLTDDIRDDSLTVVYTDMEWILKSGAPYEFTYELTLSIGRGVMEGQDITRRNPTVDTSMTVPAIVDGNDLPGLREMRMSRSVEFDVNAIYNKSSAENNEIVPTEGTTQELVFRGTLTGDDATRATAEDTLKALIGAGQVTLETRWPGYHLDGYVVGYTSNLQARFGTQSHHFDLRFIEGQPA